MSYYQPVNLTWKGKKKKKVKALRETGHGGPFLLETESTPEP
jgi:hypothetical protein